MSRITHTPAPWTIFNKVRPALHIQHVPILEGGSPRSICEMDFYAICLRPSESEANARLIAASPELLEACRKASTCMSIPDSVMEIIRAAIAKAEGR